MRKTGGLRIDDILNGKSEELAPEERQESNSNSQWILLLPFKFSHHFSWAYDTKRWGIFEKTLLLMQPMR